MKKTLLFFIITFFTVSVNAQNLSVLRENSYNTSGGKVKLEFKYKKGSTYRILSTVNETVYVNGRLDHAGVILNRVTSKVTGTDENGTSTLDCNFMTTEESTGFSSGNTFTYGEDYKSIYKITKQGVYEISPEYFMPTVRDCPVFPDKEVEPGDTWTYEGHEAHDMRRIYGIKDPFKIPFSAEYTYLGTEDNLHVIHVKYDSYTEAPELQNPLVTEYPVQMAGYSDELIYFDNEKGIIDHYTESFRIAYVTSRGNRLDFKGTAHAEVNEIVQVNSEENVTDVQKKVDNMGIENVTVKQGDKGLTLSIENIKFKADSAVLLESEKIKLKQIAEILEAFPENDILISGHTALAGTEKVRQRLSEQRAQAVADYLIKLGVRDKYHIFTKGFGATHPVAPNTNEEGKAKNRRVEITILDN
ncbi:MAG: OmpA family protein [Treponema sp.]|nr:OmpA family protein [Treponema sp.]